MNHILAAKLFYLTEPSRGVFVVNFRIGAELQRMEISKLQLANFLVDGAGMALRSPQHGAGGQQPAPPVDDASASPREPASSSRPHNPQDGAGSSIFREAH